VLQCAFAFEVRARALVLPTSWIAIRDRDTNDEPASKQHLID
jgi:hypothetical protein